MSKSAPLYRGTIDREFLKQTIKAAWSRAAKGNIEQEIGRLVNDIERFLVAELLRSTTKVMDGV